MALDEMPGDGPSGIKKRGLCGPLSYCRLKTNFTFYLDLAGAGRKILCLPLTPWLILGLPNPDVRSVMSAS